MLLKSLPLKSAVFEGERYHKKVNLRYLCPSVFCSNKLLDPPLKQVGDQRPRQRAAAFWPQPSWVLG